MVPSYVTSAIPKVSVAMITYNHERFIAQAIESVLTQEADFSIELVVGEDCSTDGTRAIVERYARANPGRIRPLLHATNIGASDNFGAVFAACRGEYVALLEGDDYWTSREKLRKQVAILDSHPEASFCHHNVLVVFDDPSEASRPLLPESSAKTTIEDIILHWRMATGSIVFRKALLPSLPPWHVEIACGDWMIAVLLAAQGPVHYLNEMMGVYRRHGSGTSRFFDDRDFYMKQGSLLFRHFDEWSGGKYHRLVRKKLSEVRLDQALFHRSSGHFLRFLRAAAAHFRYADALDPLGLLNSVRYLVVPKRWNNSLSQTWVVRQLKRLRRAPGRDQPFDQHDS